MIGHRYRDQLTKPLRLPSDPLERRIAVQSARLGRLLAVAGWRYWLDQSPPSEGQIHRLMQVGSEIVRAIVLTSHCRLNYWLSSAVAARVLGLAGSAAVRSRNQKYTLTQDRLQEVGFKGLVEFAHVLGLVDDKDYKDLKTINRLRNTVAHRLHPEGDVHRGPTYKKRRVLTPLGIATVVSDTNRILLHLTEAMYEKESRNDCSRKSR